MKVCNKCSIEKLESEFHVRKEGKRRNECIRCCRLASTMRNRQYTKEQAEVFITKIDEDADLSLQGLKACRICKQLKNLDQYSMNKKPDKQYPRSECKQCHFEAHRKRNQLNFPFMTWQNCRNRAERLRVPFNLTTEYLKLIFDKQGGLCGLTGLSMEVYARGRPTPWSASVDRIIPDLGYVEGNVRWVIWGINIALHNWGEDVFRRMCKAYLNH